MNIPDLILMVVALFSVWLGVQKGFINATADLLIWIGSVVVAFFGYPYVASLFGKPAQASPWLLPVCFLLILMVSGFVFSWVARRLLRGVPPSVWDSRVNHAFGLLPGIVNALITTSILALLFISVPFSDSFSDQAEASKAVAMLTEPAEWAQEKLTPVFNEAIKRSMTKMTVEPESDAMVMLPFKDSTVKERPDLEAQMLVLVNQERVSRGLKALAPDTAMRRVAIAHSRDMFARGYFAHETPEKKSPFDRMKAAHIRYQAAGENLALARTLQVAHTGLMNSPGHRANILNGRYGRLGIGILDGGRHGLMVSQEFRN